MRIKRLTFSDFERIRAVYERELPEIMKSDRWHDVHFFEWKDLLSPIEWAMWDLIRHQSIPFYPQFPVGRYFVDFGNPHRRLAIECDGHNYHDWQRDRDRDWELLKQHGWTVVRFSGMACRRLTRLPDISQIRPLEGVDAFEPHARDAHWLDDNWYDFIGDENAE